MELKEFIKEVLTSIFEGVSEAQIEIAEKGGMINPEVSTTTTGVLVSPTNALDRSASGKKNVNIAEFDVVLAVTDKEQKGGKIGVLLGNLGLGATAGKSGETSQVTHVKFSVPYKLP